MENGVEGEYKTVYSKKMTINGYEVEVTYNKLPESVKSIKKNKNAKNRFYH